MQGIASHCLSDNYFTIFSDMDEGIIVDPSGDEDRELVFENIDPVEAFLGSDGSIERFGGKLARDWFDVFFVKRVSADTGVQMPDPKVRYPFLFTPASRPFP